MELYIKNRNLHESGHVYFLNIELDAFAERMIGHAAALAARADESSTFFDANLGEIERGRIGQFLEKYDRMYDSTNREVDSIYAYEVTPTIGLHR